MLYCTYTLYIVLKILRLYCTTNITAVCTRLLLDRTNKGTVGRVTSFYINQRRAPHSRLSGHLPLNLLGAHYVTALILFYKRSHGDRHRRLVTMKTGGAWTIELKSGVALIFKIQSSKSGDQPFMVTAVDLHIIVCLHLYLMALAPHHCL